MTERGDQRFRSLVHWSQAVTQRPCGNPLEFALEFVAPALEELEASVLFMFKLPSFLAVPLTRLGALFARVVANVSESGQEVTRMRLPAGGTHTSLFVMLSLVRKLSLKFVP